MTGWEIEWMERGAPGPSWLGYGLESGQEMAGSAPGWKTDAVDGDIETTAVGNVNDDPRGKGA